MFVRDQDGVQSGQILTDSGQAFRDFAAAQAGIDENARAIRGYQNRVAGTAAREDADLDDLEPPYSAHRVS
jgi:hypothetical protein